MRCYVDGLNFYYRVAQRYGFKWIDLEGLLSELVKTLEPQAEIEKILLFAAEVKGEGTPGDARERQRQYLGALKQHSRGKIEFIPGYLVERTKRAMIMSGDCEGQVEKFKRREEKCTDVNLACQMVEDAYTVAGEGGDFDVACLVSNDADMAAALKIKRRLQQKTFLIMPGVSGSSENKEETESDSDSPVIAELAKHVPKVNRISGISRDLVFKHPLPEKVGEYTPPDAIGWSIEAARQAWASRLRKHARNARLKARKQR